MSLISKIQRTPRLFNLVSWGFTAIIAFSSLSITIWKVYFTTPIYSSGSMNNGENGVELVPSTSELASIIPAITRRVSLKTDIPSGRPRYDAVEYTVLRGDSVFGIADEFILKPETVYWANTDSFRGSPDSIQVGQVLIIPPVDGVYYQWEANDTIESVSENFDVSPEDIINYPGNDIDLTNPQISAGTFLMVPGGERNDQPLFIQTVTRSSGAVAAACGGGYVSRGFFTWPAAYHYLSGNDFTDSHHGIDIAATEGVGIYAADNGVVTMAKGGYNYGYGNVVQIDHGNGFVTLYAHLSQINVVACQSVSAGATIGLSGNTGNSYGAHLHFEIRYSGSTVNPWNYLPPP